MQLRVIEHEVDEELVAFNFEAVLVAEKGKADTQFEQEITQPRYQALFNRALVGGIRDSQKIEGVRVFDEVACQV